MQSHYSLSIRIQLIASVCVGLFFPVFAGHQVVTSTIPNDTSIGSLPYVILHSVAGDTVLFNLPGNDTIQVPHTLSISITLTLKGPNSATGKRPVIFTADPNPASSGLLSISSGIVTIRNVILLGGRAAGLTYQGGVMAIDGATTQVVMDSVVVAKGSAQQGGGIYNGAAIVTITRSMICGNFDSLYGGYGSGGGIYNSSGTMRISDCIISDNTIAVLGSSSSDCHALGSGIYNTNGKVVLLNSTVCNNYAYAAGSTRYSAYAAGGGIYSDYGKIVLVNSTVCNNRCDAYSVLTADAYGGGVYCGKGFYPATGSLTAINSTIANNSVYAHASDYSGTAGYAGGGIYSAADSCYLLNSLLVNNTGSDFSAKADTLGFAVSTLFGSGQPDTVINCQIGITTQQVFGTTTPTLADNGGPTPTILIDSFSIAYQTGMRTGTLDTDYRGAYFETAAWILAETGLPASGITEITADQRGAVRHTPPCIGAFEVGQVPIAIEKTEAKERSEKLEITNSPNPFNPLTVITIKGQGVRENAVDVQIFDVQGNRIQKLAVNRLNIDSGVSWDASGQPSGVYVVRVQGRGQVATKRMMLIK